MTKKLFYFLLPVLMLAACEKEYSTENETGSSYGTATFTLGGAPSTCTGATLNGEYIEGVKMIAENTVEITVNVAKAGTYIISSPIFNGVSFYGSGTFDATGSQKVLLYGDGTPAVAKTFTYPVGTNGCTFSIDYQKPATDPGTAVFTYTGAPGGCTDAVVEGLYKTGTSFTAANTVKIKVNVLTPGSYNITTNNVNGYSFSGSGSFTTIGEQVVTLTASGTPVAIGNNNFTPAGNGCSFTVNVVDGAPGSEAIFTLNGAPGACTGAVVNGSYIVGTSLSAPHTVTITANVTKAGTYSIATATVNGFSFSASGTFASTGPQPVSLKGIGTPITIGPFNFTAGTGGCTFSVDCNSGGAPSANCKECTYFPMCQGSKYVFDDVSVIGGSTERVYEFKSVTDTVIDGKNFKKVISSASEPATYYNCTNGVLTVVGYNLVSVSGTMTLKKLQQVLLRANDPIGTTWTETILNYTTNPPQEAKYIYSIADKGISVNVGGTIYNDVVKVHVEVGVDIPMVGFQVSNRGDYYYAKGIGLIWSDLKDAFFGLTVLDSKLKSYNIP